MQTAEKSTWFSKGKLFIYENYAVNKTHDVNQII